MGEMFPPDHMSGEQGTALVALEDFVLFCEYNWLYALDGHCCHTESLQLPCCRLWFQDLSLTLLHSPTTGSKTNKSISATYINNIIYGITNKDLKCY